MRILIAGLAKTGTTALLYLLKNSLPSVDEVLFEPKTCDADWLAGHPNALAKVILDKQLRVADFMAFERKITIVRDPRDRLISALLYGQFHANYLFDDDKVALVRQCLERKEQDPAAVSLTEILQLLRRVSGAPAIANHRHLARLAAHLEVFDSYCAATPDALLYRYEDLVPLPRPRALRPPCRSVARCRLPHPRTAHRLPATPLGRHATWARSRARSPIPSRAGRWVAIPRSRCR